MKNMIRLFLTIGVLVTVSACTRMPVEYRESYPAPAATFTDSNRLSIVGSAAIGAVQTYTDQATGVTSRITVDSEYFSANGRLCRRYTQRSLTAASKHLRLACNGRDGWIDIPVAVFAG